MTVLRCFLWAILSLFHFPSYSHPPSKTQYQWQPGYFDIHHINTGRGNAIFMIFPDGTNLLYDAGAKLFTGKEHPNWKEHLADVHPNSSKSVGEWVVAYIDHVLPKDRLRKIDYAVLSHFHVDHFGHIDNEISPLANNGAYRLGGITQVGHLIPISMLLDRNCPDYDYPIDLKAFYQTKKANHSVAFLNYLQFIEYQSKHGDLECASIKVGSATQIALLSNPQEFPPFEVRNVKSNQRYWSGDGETTFDYEYPEPLFNEELNTYNENPLSIGLKFSYGDFEYVTAGDIAGVNGFPNFDMETTLGKVVGKVDVITLNHHGANDSTNESYLKATSPQLIVHQALHGHHYYKPVIERIKNLTKAKVLTSNADDKVREEIGSLYDEVFLNEEGHIVIRVKPGGDEFYALVLDDNSEDMSVLEEFGPFKSTSEEYSGLPR